jgi:hypothetical protein
MGECEFGRGQRVGDQARFMGNPDRIGGNEGNAANDRDPDANHIDAVERQFFPRNPGQGQVDDRNHRGEDGGERRDQQRFARWQRRSRNRNRGQEQQRERIEEATRQRQKPAQLAEVKGQLNGGKVRGKLPLGAIAEEKPDIEPRRKRDQRQALPERQRKAQAQMHKEHANGLPHHGQPAQQHQRLQAQWPPVRSILADRQALFTHDFRERPCAA